MKNFNVRTLVKVLASVLVLLGAGGGGGCLLGGCAVLTGVSNIARDQVVKACGAPEAERAVLREQLSRGGLWVHCVEPGTAYNSLQAVPVPGQP